MPPLVRFTSVQLKRGYTEVRRAALRAPVDITHNGQPDVVVMARDAYEALVALAAPRARYADELSAETVAALREPLPEHGDDPADHMPEGASR